MSIIPEKKIKELIGDLEDCTEDIFDTSSEAYAKLCDKLAELETELN